MSKILPCSGFALAPVKKETAPAHPEDVYIHCGCAKCEARWQKQFSAYIEYRVKGSTNSAHLPNSTKE